MDVTVVFQWLAGSKFSCQLLETWEYNHLAYSTGKIHGISMKISIGTRQVLVTPGHMVQSNSRIFSST